MADSCGAKTRSGQPCKAFPMANGRCRMHGGSSTGPKDQAGNSNAATHGFYSDALQPDERPLWDRVQIGSVDDEIRLMRVKLHRLVRLSGSEDVAGLVDSALEVAQKHDTHPVLGRFDKSEIKVKSARYGELIIQAIETIRKLELSRKALQGDDDPDKAERAPIVGFDVRIVTGS